MRLSISIVGSALSRIQDIYRFAAPAQDLPRGRTLSIVRHLRMKRPFECSPLSRVSAYSAQDSPWLLNRQKIDGADFLYAPNTSVVVVVVGGDMWAKSPPRFPHAVKVLLYSYVLASRQYPDGQQRLNLFPAVSRIGPIGNCVCLVRRSGDTLIARITESETLARRGWVAISQREPALPLTDAMFESSKVRSTQNLRHLLQVQIAKAGGKRQEGQDS